MVDVVNGKDRVRAWPRARGKPKTAKAKQLQDSFRNANEACKYWDPRNIISVDELRKGTPVLIRDLQIMMMYNRFAYFGTTDGRLIQSVQARQDVSDSLDSICPLPGAILIRTADAWRYIAPPTDVGLGLVSTVDGLAAWSVLAPGGVWGEITGTITAQADLVAALAGKLNTGLAALKANNLSDLASAATARTNLGLGSAATHPATDFTLVANNLSDLTNIVAARANLGLGSAATHAATDFMVGSNNLSELTNISAARAALDVYSTTQVNALVTTGGGSLFPLAFPPLSGWSWVNQGIATITTNANGSATLRAVKQAGTQIRLRMRNLPVGAYTATVGLIASARRPINFEWYGLAMRNSASGKLRIFGQDTEAAGQFIFGQNFDTPTTFNSNIASVLSMYAHSGPIFFQAQDDGTNITLRWSEDGYAFTDYAAFVRTSFITADQIGFFAMESSNVMDLTATCFFWDVH